MEPKTYEGFDFDLYGYVAHNSMPKNKDYQYVNRYEYMLLLKQKINRCLAEFKSINKKTYTVKGKTNQKLYNLLTVCDFITDIPFDIEEIGNKIEFTDNNGNKIPIRIYSVDEEYKKFYDEIENDCLDFSEETIKIVNKIREYLISKKYEYIPNAKHLAYELRTYKNTTLFNDKDDMLDINLVTGKQIEFIRTREDKKRNIVVEYFYDKPYNTDNTCNENFLTNVKFKRRSNPPRKFNDEELNKVRNIELTKKEISTFKKNMKNIPIQENIMKLLDREYYAN
jgi:hypothetical protein